MLFLCADETHGMAGVGGFRNLSTIFPNNTSANSSSLLAGGYRNPHQDDLDGQCYYHGNCSNGKVIPFWQPQPDELPIIVLIGRAVVLLFALAYLFLGVSIISDKFIQALEHMISQKRRVRVVSPSTGEEQFISVPIWNATVAHLVLAVVGSCAPEILLATIDVLVHNFTLGELGPATIVGSGAYNLFIVTAICIGSVQKADSKRIKDMHIFFVTSAFGIFGYAWLYAMIKIISPQVVEMWEAILTLAFFPIAVLASYLANKQCFGAFSRIGALRYRSPSVSPSMLTESGNQSTNNLTALSVINNNRLSDYQPTKSGSNDDDKSKIVQHRSYHRHPSSGNIQKTVERRQERFAEISTELRRKYPGKSNEEICELAQLALVNELPKSLTFYRSQAVRRYAGAGDVITRKKLRETVSRNLLKAERRNSPTDLLLRDKNQQYLSFEPHTYTVVEDVGSFKVNVVRLGLDLNNEVSVGFKTVDGTGRADMDYRHIEGRLIFHRGDMLKQITIEVIDDEIFNDDTVFYVVLFDSQAAPDNKGVFSTMISQHLTTKPEPSHLKVHLGANSRATVTKLDDDHGGIFHFEEETMTVEESVGELVIKVVRSSGGKGCVIVPARIEPIDAKPFDQYVDPGKIEIYFDSRQSEGFVKIKVIDEGKLRKRLSFRVVLDPPYWAPVQSGVDKYDVEKLGMPLLKSPTSMTVEIVESARLKQIVGDIATMDVYSNFVTTKASWREQLRLAVVVETPNQGDEAEHETVNPRWQDYLLHVVALFWKVLVALTPPIELWHGWPTAFCCLALMAFVTLLVDDLAVQLGCTIGMSDHLTAITFVSLGTTLPDMFASRVAALREETADAAIGHISGAVVANVFIGIGLPWTIATVKHAISGDKLVIQPAALGLSVVVYFTFAVICIAILLLRRLPPIHGELGGPKTARTITLVLFVSFWLIHVTISALNSYCIIETSI